MLDPGMQEFADEMQAKPRPRRASTRRLCQMQRALPQGDRHACHHLAAPWYTRRRLTGRLVIANRGI